MADRWILTHFAFSLNSSGAILPGVYQCIAVSKTGDPVSGGYYLYAVQMDPGTTGLPPAGAIADYPKFGIWTDCLYMGANVFNSAGTTYLGPLYGSFSRSDLYQGKPLTMSLVYPGTASVFSSFPAHVNGKTPGARPPAGRPEFFVSESQSAFAWEIRTFTAGPNCGAGGTLSAITNVSQTSYTAGSANVQQPNTTTTLDSLYDRLMARVHYRNVGGTESLWVNHTVRNNGTTVFSKIQWAQLDVTGGAIATAPVQQQVFGDDVLWRWMGSVAADRVGNMALGYSTSGPTAPNFPNIAYAGRLAGDPLGTLPQTETVMTTGGGSQIFNCGGGVCRRWGDYSSLTLDPTDDCTFWFTSQYYSNQANGSGGNWNTQIGSFKYPSCTAPTTGADLRIAKTHTGNFAPGQTGATYDIAVSNVGNAPSFGIVTVTDTVPGGLTATGIAGTGWTCVQPSGPCTRSDVLANGSSYPSLTLTVNVAANAPVNVQNVATVSGGSDQVLTNNSSTDSTDIVVPGPAITSVKVLYGSRNYTLTGSPRNRLPWQITGIQVTFAAPITVGTVNSLTGVTATGLSGLGTAALTWTINPVSLGAFNLTLQGTGPDALKDGNGGVITTYNQLMRVLMGDYNDDGVVNATDIAQVNAQRTAPYNQFADIDGNGVVDITDVNLVRAKGGTILP
jgi:uncharacterized repeat protein (TIGR01451 family)